MVHPLTDPPKLKSLGKARHQLVVDRRQGRHKRRHLYRFIGNALNLADGIVVLNSSIMNWVHRIATPSSPKLACPNGHAPSTGPRSLPFNSPYGACPE